MPKINLKDNIIKEFSGKWNPDNVDSAETESQIYNEFEKLVELIYNKETENGYKIKSGLPQLHNAVKFYIAQLQKFNWKISKKLNMRNI